MPTAPKTLTLNPNPHHQQRLETLHHQHQFRPTDVPLHTAPSSQHHRQQQRQHRHRHAHWRHVHVSRSCRLTGTPAWENSTTAIQNNTRTDFVTGKTDWQLLSAQWKLLLLLLLPAQRQLTKCTQPLASPTRRVRLPSATSALLTPVTPLSLVPPSVLSVPLSSSALSRLRVLASGTAAAAAILRCEKAHAVIAASPTNSPARLPVWASHTSALRSALALASHAPSLLNATAVTVSLCSPSAATQAPLPASHSHSARPPQPVTRRLPSGENASSVTASPCCSTRRQVPLRMSQSRALLSYDPVASSVSSWLRATACRPSSCPCAQQHGWWQQGRTGWLYTVGRRFR